jgi:hypothetical protein
MSPVLPAVALAAFGLWAFPATAAEPLGPEDAKGHIGETATVCGVMASAEYAANEQNQPTLLDLGKAPPGCDFHRRHLWGKPTEIRDPRDLAPRQAHLCDGGRSTTTRGSPRLSLPIRANWQSSERPAHQIGSLREVPASRRV